MHGIENEYKTQDDGWNTTRNVDCKTSCLRYLALQTYNNPTSWQWSINAIGISK